MKFGPHLTALVKSNLKHNVVPALFGEPGIGKSAFFRSITDELGTKLFVLACNTLSDKADLTAPRLLPSAGGSFQQEFHPHQKIQQAIEYARDHPHETPILFMDEINRTTADVTSGTLTLITEREIGREPLPKNLRIAVAGNDKGNVAALDDASISRFVKYVVEPDAQTFMALMGTSLNEHIKKVLIANPEFIFMKTNVEGEMYDGDPDDDGAVNATVSEMFEGEGAYQITTPRTIEYLNDFLNDVNDDDIRTWASIPSKVGKRDTNYLAEAIEGFVGNTPFAHQITQSVIETSLMNQSTPQAVGGNAPKPTFYDNLAALGSQDLVEDFLDGLDNRARSQALVYAVFDTNNNVRLIEALMETFNAGATSENMDTESMSTLTTLAQAGRLDRRNIDAMIATRTTLAMSIENVFGLLGAN